jgi:nicotinamide mononucleotide adenylyltransferase
MKRNSKLVSPNIKGPIVFLGKFQPPHVGHILTICELLKSYPDLVVGITNGKPNRYSFELRSEILRKIFPEIECSEISGEIEKSTDNLRKLYGKQTIFLSGNHNVLNKLSERGYATDFVSRSNDDIYTGTAIRSLINESFSDKQTRICSFEIVSLNFLKPIEKIFSGHFENLESKILEDGEIRQPIIICRDTGAVLDGSHRFAFLMKHGFVEAPVMVVNYADESIFVGNRVCHRFKHTDEKWLTKNKILQVAYSGELLPPRTTRHFFSVPKSPWPVKLNALKRKNSRSIDELLDHAPIKEQIEHNEAYLEEVHEEYEALITYLAEQVQVRVYLRDQIAKMRDVIEG